LHDFLGHLAIHEKKDENQHRHDIREGIHQGIQAACILFNDFSSLWHGFLEFLQAATRKTADRAGQGGSGLRDRGGGAGIPETSRTEAGASRGAIALKMGGELHLEGCDLVII
jgi:hypothetical protein